MKICPLKSLPFSVPTTLKVTPLYLCLTPTAASEFTQFPQHAKYGSIIQWMSIKKEAVKMTPQYFY